MEVEKQKCEQCGHYDYEPHDSWLDCLAALKYERDALRHQLNDPLYQYAGSRIHRDAIASRNAEIDQLRAVIVKVWEMVRDNPNAGYGMHFERLFRRVEKLVAKQEVAKV